MPITPPLQTMESSQYKLVSTEGIAGDWFALTGMGIEETRINTGQASELTLSPLTVATPAGTTYTLTINFVDNNQATVTRTLTLAIAAGQTADQAAVSLAAAINANNDFNDVISATAATGGIVNLKGRPFRKVNSLTAAAAGGAGTITAASTIVQPGVPLEIPFGWFAGWYPGYNDNETSTVYAAANLKILGIALHKYWGEAEYPYDLNRENRGYPANSTVALARKGKVWVPVKGAIALGKAYVDPLTGQPVGSGLAGAVGVSGAEYIRMPNADGLALMELNLPFVA